MAAVVAFDGPAAAAGAAAAVGGAAACTAAAGAGAAGGAGLGAVAGSAADSVSPAAAPIACADASCWRANSSLAAVFAALRCCPTSTAACAFALTSLDIAARAARLGLEQIVPDRTETEGEDEEHVDSQDLKSLRAAEAQCEDLEVPLVLRCGGYGGERSCRGRSNDGGTSASSRAYRHAAGCYAHMRALPGNRSRSQHGTGNIR